MTKNLNLYGDLENTFGEFGHGISDQRLDDLDHRAIETVKASDEVSILDLGAGTDRIAREFIKVNPTVKVTLVDKVFNRNFRDYERVRFIDADVLEYLPGLQTDSIDIVYSQRMFHYLKHSDLLLVVQELQRIIRPGGHLFISTSGMASELSDGYEAKSKCVENRFGRLSALMSNKHNIHKNVCLYSLNEIIKVMSDAEFKILKGWQSKFGNNKVVARKA